LGCRFRLMALITPLRALALLHRRENTMARKKPKSLAEFVLFDVEYVDGTRTSNRKVPSAALGGLEGDAPAQEIIESQDLEIAKRSGQTRGAIKSIARSVVKALAK